MSATNQQNEPADAADVESTCAHFHRVRSGMSLKDSYDRFPACRAVQSSRVRRVTYAHDDRSGQLLEPSTTEEGGVPAQSPTEAPASCTPKPPDSLKMATSRSRSVARAAFPNWHQVS